jgi:hypothetical protein
MRQTIRAPNDLIAHLNSYSLAQLLDLDPCYLGIGLSVMIVPGITDAVAIDG